MQVIMTLMEALKMFKKNGENIERIEFYCEDLNYALVKMYWIDERLHEVLRVDIRDLEIEDE